MNYLALVIFVLIMTITPGPNNILLTVSGTKFGFKKSLGFVIGLTLGLNSQIILFSMGLGVLFTKYPHVQNIVKIPGILYILYLAYKLSFKSGSKSGDSNMEKPLTLLDGLLFQYLNPKAYLMTLTTASLYSAPLVIILLVVFIIAPFSTSSWALFGSVLGKLTLNKDTMKVNRILGVITAASVVFII